MRRWISFAVGLCLCLSAWAEAVVKATADKDTVKLGEEVKVTLEVEGKGISCEDVVFPIAGEFPKDVVVKDSGPCEKVKGGVRKVYTLAFFSLNPKLPPLPVIVNGQRLNTPELTFKIRELLPKDVSKVEPRPSEGPYEVGFPWAVLFGVLILLAGVLAGLWWLRRRRAIAEEELAPRPYWEIAQERLQHLRKSSLLELGKYRQFYYELTEILRYYLQNRYGIPALEMTNSELKRALPFVPIDPSTRSRINELLDRSGPVKYAGQEISPELAIKDLELVESLVVPPSQEDEE